MLTLMCYVGSLICGFLCVLGDKTLMIVKAEEMAFFEIWRCELGSGVHLSIVG